MTRVLRLFSDVREGESASALLLTLDVFLILTAYYFVKPAREALILAGGGAEVKSYAAAGQALLLAGAVPLYGLLAARLPRRRLINAVTWFFAGCLGLFYFLARAGVPLGVAFYLWVGVFNLMIVAQFWSFANDLYTKDEGERLFPIIAFGASSGAVLGSFLAGRLIGRFGVLELLLAAALFLLLSLFLTNAVDARERRRTESGLDPALTTAALPAASTEVRLDSGQLRKLREAYDEVLRSGARPREEGRGDPEPVLAPEARGSAAGAFRLVFRHRYLLLIALLMLLLNWVNTTGEYILARVVSGAARDAVAAGTAGGLDEGAWIGVFYSNFFSVVNGLGLFVQLFLVSRILKYAGVRLALLALPLIALGGYLLLAFVPVLGIVRWAKTAENATDYSLQNTVRNVLFLPLTRQEKYTAKQATDAFFVRAGDVLSAGTVFAGTTWLGLRTAGFALVNLALVGVWIVLAIAIGRRYVRLVAGRAPAA
ncbi:MAG: NTP/NDP exchange transporter [Gemmatimonadota bacterium]